VRTQLNINPQVLPKVKTETQVPNWVELRSGFNPIGNRFFHKIKKKKLKNHKEDEISKTQ
jgi:hypothetical protein